MTQLSEWLRACLENNVAACVIEIISVRGSAPRGVGTKMIVSAEAIRGTIGGGVLEWIAMGEARRALLEGSLPREIEVPLGSDIGQCCGGHVGLRLLPADRATLKQIVDEERRCAEQAPEIVIFGHGHVGRALACALAPLPFSVRVIDTRAQAMLDLPAGVSGQVCALPESVIAKVRPGSGFVVATHEHALDFVLTAAALQHPDAAYVGLIGSKSKRAKFEQWYKRQFASEFAGRVASQADRAASSWPGSPQQCAPLDRLVCPIGGAGVGDKRPEVIAALVAAELLQACLGRGAIHAARNGKAAERQIEPSMGEK